MHPVYFGSAITGAGVAELRRALPRLLPVRHGDASGPVAGTVFKVDRGPSGEKVALLHLVSGTLAVRDRVRVVGAAHEEKVTGIGVYHGGGVERRSEVVAGRIARVIGLDRVRVGDVVGDVGLARPLVHEFAPPTLETIVEPAHPDDPHERARLHAALTSLAEQDPLIDLRQDDARGEIAVSLYGEVQKEVIAATLRADHGVEVSFRQSTTICIERVTGTGSCFEVIGTPSNPFLATVGLRVEPAAPGSGVGIRLEVELGSMPASFFRAVEETVHRTLEQGLHGWQVPDCVVVITHTGYWPRQSRMHAVFDKAMSSTAGDFRNLTPLVLMTALRRAGTRVEEPVHRFDFDLPSDVLGRALTALAHVRAVPRETEVRGEVTHLSGEVPAARVHDLQRRVPGLTRGQGDLVCSFEGHRPVSGPPPERARTDLDPLHRREYLLRVAGKL